MPEKSISVEEFIENGSKEPVYLDTAWGRKLVSRIDWPQTNPWAVCPKDNGGFGMSYAVSNWTRLYFKE